MNDSVRSEPKSSRLGRILREAEELFLQEGFLHFSIDELARRLRCSKRTIYKLASSRDRFIESIISRHLMRLNENLFEAAEAAPNWTSAIGAILGATVRTFGLHATQFVTDLARFPGGVRLLRETEAARLELLERVVAAGVADGSFRKVDPTVAAYAMIGASRRLSEDDFLTGTRIGWNQAMKELSKLILDGLLTKDPSKCPRRGRKSSRRRAALD
jgi:AcrR family transcriptional regulator